MRKWFIRIICACCMLVPTMARATVTTRVGNGTVCPGSEVDILISVSDTMRNVGAISLAFNYDNTKLGFAGYADVIPEINNNLMVNANNGKVYISWYTVQTPITIGDTLLFIRFQGLANGSSNLTWDVSNCEYANGLGNVIESNYSNGSVTVYAQPAITSHPSNVSITAGNNVYFQVGASGQSIAYQWQRKAAGTSDWANLTNTSTYSNVTSYRMTVNNVTQQMTGDQFRCVVSGTCTPEVYSNAATLTVAQTTIVTSVGSTSSCPNMTFAIPITVTNCNNVGAISLSLRYNSTNYLTYVGYQNINSGMLPEQCEVNASNGTVYFTWAGSGSSLDIGTGTLVELLFESTPGNSVFLWNTAQCEYSDPMGNVLSSSYSSGSVTVYNPPFINSNPVNQSIYEGNSTTFSVNAGGQGISYTWQVSTDGGYNWSNCVNGTYYANVSSRTLTVRNVTVAMSGYQYRCVVCGTCEPCAYSSAATLTVNYIIHTAISGTSACPGTVFNCPVTVSNFNNVGAVSLALSYNPDVLTFVGVTDVNAALGSGLLSNASNGRVLISWYSTSGVSIGSGTLLQIQFRGNTGSSNLTWDAANSEYAMPDGTPITMTFNNASASIYSEPYVTSQPESQCLFAGQSTSFSINAGGQSIGYQWQVSTNGGTSWSDLTNGEHYANVTSRILNVNNVATWMNNYYFRCKVTGSCGSPAYSEYAKLAVDIAQPLIIAENATWPCTGEVSQDILVEHFDNIGAFSLVIDYDTNYLRYLEHFDVNPAIDQNSFVINHTMGRIYVTYASGAALNLGNATLFKLRFDSSGGNSTNRWQTSLCEVADFDGNVFETNYVNGYVNVFSNCSFTDIEWSYWYEDILDLCNRGIVTGYECKAMPDEYLTRSQMAKMLFIALFGSPNASVVTDGFPSPFLDMQKTNTYYYKYAKALSYLEYRDGISVFDRDKMNFNPEGTVRRDHFIKALLETFHVPPLFQDTVVFADVPVERDFHEYINQAYKIGILVDVDTLPTKYFHPDDTIKRGDAMGYLDWFLKLYSVPQPNNSQDITQSDFFIPGNYTPYNFTAVLGQEMGNFNHTTKSSFNIPARGFPLQFEHTYNSFLTELPRQIFATDPLGQGWSHNYNAYLINTDEVLDDYGNPLATPCIIIFWPDGTIQVYDNENAPEHPKPITKGVYNTVTKVGADQYTVKMKDQSVYTFTKIAGSDSQAPYMMTRMEDRHGNATTLTYGLGENDLPRISTVSDDAGRDLVFTYHPNSNYLKKVTDPLGRSVSFEVEDDNLTTYYNAKGDTTCYYYDTLTHYNHLLDSIKLPKGNVITNTYEQRKLTSTKYNNGSPTTIQHNANYVANANVFYSSTVTEMVDNHAVSSNHQYDKNGNETHVSIGNSADVTKTFDDDDPNLVKSITNNKTGLVVEYEYDSLANVTKLTKRGGDLSIIKQYEYNVQNDVIKQIDAKGNETHFTYEGGNLTKITDALGHESHINYNGYGQPITIIDALGNQVGFDYDDYGNKNYVSFPTLNLSASMGYDLASRMIQSTDFNGNSKYYVYDLDDALHKETNALGDSTIYVYDKNGNLTAIRNAAGDSTLFTYDFNSDMLLSQSFQGVAKHYSYNEDGTLHTLTTPNGDVFTMSYDSEGRVINDGYATYSYDEVGNLHSITKDGKSIENTYDIFNRLESQSYDGKTVSYGYDANDNVTQITYPGSYVVSYSYNAMNQLETVTDWNGHATTYSYRADGSLSSFLYPNQVLNHFEYDAAGHITDMGSKRGDGSDIVHYHFEIDANGNQLSSLIREQFVDMPIVNWPNVNYNYNALNRLLSDSTNVYQNVYQYDYNGNMTSKGGATYDYDAMNNLTSYSHNGNYAFTYDGQGRRRSASRNGELTKFVLDQKGNVLADLNSSGEVQCYYVYGRGLVSRIQSDGNTNYYIYDCRGSVVAMTDDTEEANVTHKYQYDAYGNILQMEEADFNPFRYVGKYGVTYEDSCLYFMHARYYDPTIGRFLSEDPIWNTNLYVYADNNSIMKIDPNGKMSDFFAELTFMDSDLIQYGAETMFIGNGLYVFLSSCAADMTGFSLLSGSFAAFQTSQTLYALAAVGPQVLLCLGAAVLSFGVGLWIGDMFDEEITNAMASVIYFMNYGIDNVFDRLFLDSEGNLIFKKGWDNIKETAGNIKDKIGLEINNLKKIFHRESNRQKKAKNCINALKK